MKKRIHRELLLRSGGRAGIFLLAGSTDACGEQELPQTFLDGRMV